MALHCKIEAYPAYKIKVSGSLDLLETVYEFFESHKLLKEPKYFYGRKTWTTTRIDVNLVEKFERKALPEPWLIVDRGYFVYLILYLYDLKQRHGIEYKTEINPKSELKLTKEWREILRDDQIKAFEEIVKLKGGATQMGTGSGKALPLTTKILTHSGFVPLGSLKVGDKIFSQDGALTTIVGYYPQGVKPCYTITTVDGQAIECCDEHLWQTQYPSKGAQRLKHGQEYWDIRTTREMLNRHLRGKKGDVWEIPVNLAVQYSKKELPIHPYVLGILISEGSLASHNTEFSSPEIDIVNRVRSYLGSDYDVHSSTSKNYSWYIKHLENTYRHPLKMAIKNLGLNVKSESKFIPETYLQGSIEQRRLLLAGLFDGDGNVRLKKQGKFYSTVSKQLADDVVNLCRSLGYRAKLRIIDRTHEDKGINYTVNILTTDVIWMSEKHTRRYESYVQGNRVYDYTKVKIKAIEYMGKKEMACIMVDHPSHLFIAEDYIVTHNTEIILALCLSFLKLHTDKNILITAPKNVVVEELKSRFEKYAYSNLLDEMPKKGETYFSLLPRIKIINPLGFTRSKAFADTYNLKWLSSVGMVIYDEMHRSTSNSYIQLKEKLINVEYAYGFSATNSTKRLNVVNNFRSFGYEEQKRLGMTGPAMVHKFAKDVGKGIDYIRVYGNFGKGDVKDGTDYTKIVDSMTKEAKFLDALRTIITRCGDRVFFIPIPFIEAGERIYRYLMTHGIMTLHWTGDFSLMPGIKSLEDIKRELKSGKYRALIATAAASEGVDIAELSAVILSCGSGDKNIPQNLGRAGRRGKPIVFNIYNEEQQTLRNQATRRHTIINTHYETEPVRWDL